MGKKIPRRRKNNIDKYPPMNSHFHTHTETLIGEEV